MTRRSRSLPSGATALAVTLASIAPMTAQAAEPPADASLLFVNGTVLTPQGSTEAIAVRDGAIIAVGRSEEILKLPHAGATTVDLQGRTLMPGLYDMHVHVYPAGQAKLACKIPQGAGAPVIFATVKACAAKAKPGAWITGGSWVAAALKPGEQTRQLLDRAAPDNPVMLDDESLHSVWANSRALQLGGITRATANPAGGVIDRDAKGEPTGVLREAAARNLLAVLPPVPIDQQVAAIKAATDEMLSYGIIGFTDAAIRRDGAEAYARFAATGGLRQYARGCAVWGPNSGGSEGLVAARQDYSKGRFQLDCVKMFLDGVPLEGRTAVMLQPYEPRHGEHGSDGTGGEKGLMMVPPDKLNCRRHRLRSAGPAREVPCCRRWRGARSRRCHRRRAQGQRLGRPAPRGWGTIPSSIPPTCRAAANCTSPGNFRPTSGGPHRSPRSISPPRSGLNG